MNNTINVQSIAKTFKNFKAINDLTLEVAKGEIYGLLGSNGAGKTTTINILLGFLEPDSGTAYINGVDTSSDPGEARKHTGYIPENVNFAVASPIVTNILKSKKVKYSSSGFFSGSYSNTELASLGNKSTIQLFCRNTRVAYNRFKSSNKYTSILLDLE